jgi:hypothetical protein
MLLVWVGVDVAIQWGGWAVATLLKVGAAYDVMCVLSLVSNHHPILP